MTIDIDHILEESNKVSATPTWALMTKRNFDEGCSSGWITARFIVDEFEVDGMQWVKLIRKMA